MDLLAERNMCINSSDVFSKAFPKMFPNSEIAQAFSCARTKATAIVKDLAKKHQGGLLQRMWNGPFSMATDGSNDSNSKLYPIVVHTVNPETLTVDAEVVSVPVLEESGTGRLFFPLIPTIYTDKFECIGSF